MAKSMGSAKVQIDSCCFCRSFLSHNKAIKGMYFFHVEYYILDTTVLATNYSQTVENELLIDNI